MNLASPTKAQQRRFMRLAEYGCIACRKEGRGYVQPLVHHCTDGKRHHDRTIPLCPGHHVGEVWGMSASEAEQRIGPSVHRNKRAFERRYGAQAKLLAEVDRWLAS